MPMRGVKCVLGNVTMADHQRCMINEPGPPCGIEPSILQIITRPSLEREAEGVVYSPTALSSCHRQSVLTRKHDWYLDVKQGYKMVRGSIIHEGMGHEPPYPGILGVVREKRMKAPINVKGVEQSFGGKPDLVVLLGVDAIQVDPGDGTPWTWINRLRIKIVDYKTRSEVGHDLVQADTKHVHQVNQYAWLAAQFLPDWLNFYTAVGGALTSDYQEHLFLNEGVILPEIHEVVVEELSIVYMDMKTTRTFTSLGFLYVQGKMLGDRINGRWRRRSPVEYEELELEPIHLFKPKYTESLIRKGIENKIDSETMLAPPLTGDDASLMCRNCAVREQCYILGRREGYSMEDQKPFVEGKHE